MIQLLEEDTKLGASSSQSESAVYSTLVSLLQSRKILGMEAAIEEIVIYGRQGESNTKKQIRSANLKEWADAIHHTWIGELDEKTFILALKIVAKFSKFEVDQCISNYFLKFYFNIDTHGLSSTQVVEGVDADILVIHAFGNPIREEHLDEAVEAIDANSYVKLTSDSLAVRKQSSFIDSLILDLYEEQEIEFYFSTSDNSKVSIESFDVSVFNELGVAISESITKKNSNTCSLLLCNCQVLKSIISATLNIRMIFRFENGPKKYLYQIG